MSTAGWVPGVLAATIVSRRRGGGAPPPAPEPPDPKRWGIYLACGVLVMLLAAVPLVLVLAGMLPVWTLVVSMLLFAAGFTATIVVALEWLLRR